MSDSSRVDAALSAKLLADAPLMALAVDGLYFDEAAQGATRFLIISLVDEHDTGMFSKRAFENGLYLVKFVEKGTSGLNADVAAARIDLVLEQATLTVTGYGVVTVQRDSRIKYTEVDDVDHAIRWQHRGGRYAVSASPS